MSLTPTQWAALMALMIPAAAACILPIASLDKDQATLKWVRGATFFIALFALLSGFFYVTRIWASGAEAAFGPLRFDHLAQFASIFILVTGALAVLQLWDHLHQEGWVKGETLSLLMFSVTGMMLFASTTHLILLFLGLELLSLPLYALAGTVRSRSAALEGGV